MNYYENNKNNNAHPKYIQSLDDLNKYLIYTSKYISKVYPWNYKKDFNKQNSYSRRIRKLRYMRDVYKIIKLGLSFTYVNGKIKMLHFIKQDFKQDMKTKLSSYRKKKLVK